MMFYRSQSIFPWGRHCWVTSHLSERSPTSHYPWMQHYFIQFNKNPTKANGLKMDTREVIFQDMAYEHKKKIYASFQHAHKSGWSLSRLTIFLLSPFRWARSYLATYLSIYFMCAPSDWISYLVNEATVVHSVGGVMRSQNLNEVLTRPLFHFTATNVHI